MSGERTNSVIVIVLNNMEIGILVFIVVITSVECVDQCAVDYFILAISFRMEGGRVAKLTTP